MFPCDTIFPLHLMCFSGDKSLTSSWLNFPSNIFSQKETPCSCSPSYRSSIHPSTYGAKRFARRLCVAIDEMRDGDGGGSILMQVVHACMLSSGEKNAMCRVHMSHDSMSSEELNTAKFVQRRKVRLAIRPIRDRATSLGVRLELYSKRWPINPGDS